MKINQNIKKKFEPALLKWYKTNKREFPWRSTKDPYHVLIAEILLQKTNASKVLPVYLRFIRKYPNAQSLSNARVSTVKSLIKHLGLLYKAQRLISLGKYIYEVENGKLPNSRDALLKIHGIGQYVASAVACFAFNKKEPIVDTNVIRVLERVFGLKSDKKRQRDDKTYWEVAASLLPKINYRDFNYALIDFSALQCTAKRPNHESCPLRPICAYHLSKEETAPIGIDLFAGAGGLSLGFEHAGFNILYAVENDKHAAETYRRNRGNRKELIVDTRNINNIKPNEILKKTGLKRGELDIVIGGPPCQGFSTSNMRTRNLANPQNQLVFKFIEFVNVLKPKWFLMENVAGLDSFDDGTFRELLIKEFSSIGYSTESIILNAVNFGVPQNRHRIFFIGNRLGIEMKFTFKLRSKKNRKPITVYDAINDLPQLVNGNLSNEMNYNKRKVKLSGYQKKMRKGMNGRLVNNLTTKHSDLAILRFKNIGQGENLLALAKRKPELVSNYKNVENCHHWIYKRLPWNKPSVTLNNYRKNMLIHPSQNRGLSVREAARLQSFPDSYLFYGSIGFQQQQVANAAPPLMVAKIAKSIRKIFS